jgi:multiple sugar transport system substrate-binding protein
LRLVSGGLALSSLTSLSAACVVSPGSEGATLPATQARQQAGVRAATGSALTLLMWGHFVPEFDRWFDVFAREWGESNNVRVRVDHVPQLETPARAAAEVASQAGHDIVQFVQSGGPNLFARHLEDQDGLMNQLERDQGGWEDSARSVALVDGHWKAFPDFLLRFELLYREDLFQQEGLKPPDTWDELLVAGRRLKAKGFPGGIGYVGNHGDANASSRAILWSFGGKYVAADGKTIAIDSPETRDALRFGKTLYEQAMTEEVFSWDDTSNNKLLASGKACYIQNPVSAYISIKKENPDLFSKIGIALPPSGPADRRTGVWPASFGIWKFAQNKPAAHAFLAHYAANWLNGFRASSGYNHPMLKGWTKKPMPILGDGDDPKLRVSQDFNPVMGFMGHPGPVTPAAEEVWQTYLIPQMFARYIKSGDLDGTVKATEEALKKIYARWEL